MTWWRKGRRTTPDCRAVLAEARSLAWAYGSSVVEPIHVLLALLEHGENIGAQLLLAACPTKEPLLPLIRRGIGTASSPGQRRPAFSASAAMLMAAARDEAVRVGHACIGTEHLVLAFLRDHASPLVAALRSQGYEATKVLEESIEVLTINGGTSSGFQEALPPARKLRKEDFPADVRSDPLVDLFLHAEARLSDAEYERNLFVQSARKRRPRTVEELARYTVDEYVNAIRAVLEAEQEEAEEDERRRSRGEEDKEG